MSDPPLIAHEASQQSHYEEIGEEYEKHYAEPFSLQYRDRFCHDPMFCNVKLAGCRALDAMCGSGPLSAYLIKRGALVTGLDISPTVVASYQANNPGCVGTCASVLDAPFPDASFDVIGVVSGFHHLQPDLDKALLELHRLLKPGGSLCFTEPHSHSLLDRLRRVWYRFDPLFESNEEAVNLEQIQDRHRTRFHFAEQRYFGNLAYIFVLNSMVMRVPLALKPYYSPLAMKIETLLNRILPVWLTCAVTCRWIKKA